MAHPSTIEGLMPRDFSTYRNDFPGLAREMNGKPLSFMDTAASAQKPQAVIDAMNEVLQGGYSNIHRGLYQISQDLTSSFEAVRGKVAKFLNAASEKEIVFTRNTTEAINLVAQSWGRTNLKAGDEILISAMEHHANIVPWQLLRDQIGVEIKIIPINDAGVLDMGAYEELLSERTKLVSIVHISNALGTINPVEDMISKAKAFNRDIAVLVDASQSVVHGRIDVQAMRPDFVVFTGHKLYGPTGVGVLYGRYDILNAMPPYQGGGDMIEDVRFDKTTYREAPYRFEAGTPAIVEVIGLGAAVDYMLDIPVDKLVDHEADLLEFGTEQLLAIDGLSLVGTAPCKAGVMSFVIDGMHPSDIGMVLDQCGVAIRTGHHCCMPLMQRLGHDSTARASIGLYTNKDDIMQLVDGLKKVKELFA